MVGEVPMKMMRISLGWTSSVRGNQFAALCIQGEGLMPSNSRPSFHRSIGTPPNSAARISSTAEGWALAGGLGGSAPAWRLEMASSKAINRVKPCGNVTRDMFLTSTFSLLGLQAVGYCRASLLVYARADLADIKFGHDLCRGARGGPAQPASVSEGSSPKSVR